MGAPSRGGGLVYGLMRRPLRFMLVFGLLLASACAGRSAPPAITPMSLEELAEAHARRPGFGTALALGQAQVAAGDFDAAAQAYRAAASLAQGRRQRADLDRALGALGRARLSAEARAAIQR